MVRGGGYEKMPCAIFLLWVSNCILLLDESIGALKGKLVGGIKGKASNEPQWQFEKTKLNAKL